jgi:UDP-N-acetylmuramoyl-tripeptide--D-alanyl-D-alanine ligase
VGTHNAMNACAAWAAMAQVGCNAAEILDGLAQARPTARRLNVRKLASGALLIDDCYNANPVSMEAALQTLQELSRGGRAFAALGDMLELGEGEEKLHRALGEAVARAGVAGYLAFGPRSRAAADAARAAGVREVEHTEDPAAAQSWLQERLRKGDALLVKGSRGMKMERVAEGLA